jgi:hypothetical protein
MSEHQIRLHGPSAEVEVALEGDTPEDCLARVESWMREGAHVELRTRRGTARINMRYVWAAEYIPSGRVVGG